MIRRWCVFNVAVEPVEFHRRALVSAMNKITQLGSKYIAEVGFRSYSQLQELQLEPGVIVLPGLESPAEFASQTVKDWFTSQGALIGTNDRILNLLRKLRTAKGIAVDQLDISTSE